MQSTSHRATDGQIDRRSRAGYKRAGDIDRALFHIIRGLFGSNRIRGQELLFGAVAALDPVKQAFILDHLFLATAGDDIDVPGRAHNAAHFHHSLVGGDAIINTGNSNRDGRMVISPGLEIGVEIRKNAALVGPRIQAHLATAFDGARHIHLARAVHGDVVVGSHDTDSPSHCSLGMGIELMLVIGGKDNILGGGRLFVAKERTALYIYQIVDGDIILHHGVHHTCGGAALGRCMVRQVAIGGCHIFLQIVRSDSGIFADGNAAAFRNLKQAPQTVAGNDAAEMVFQCIGLLVLIAVGVGIVIRSRSHGTGCANVNPIGTHNRALFNIGFECSVDDVIHTGAAHADNAAVPFGGRQASIVLLSRHKPQLACNIPVATQCAVYSVSGFVVHMGADIAHDAAAACIG